MELLVVVTLVMTLSLIAYPAFRSFVGRDEDIRVATFITHEINNIKTQAMKRNRAYVLRFSHFNLGKPSGLFEIYEGVGDEAGRCSVVGPAFNNLAVARRLARFGFGDKQDPQGLAYDIIPGGTPLDTGLYGWVPSEGNMGAPESGNLLLCIRTDGSFVRVDGGAVTPLVGPLRIQFLRFQNADGANPSALPKRNLRFDFTQAVRVEIGP